MPVLLDQWDFINHNNDPDSTKRARLIKWELFYERKINKVKRHSDGHSAAADNLLNTVLCLVKAVFNFITSVVSCGITVNNSIAAVPLSRLHPPF